MMHQLKDKIKIIFLYLFLLFSVSTIFNLEATNSLGTFFKVKEIEIKDSIYRQEFIKMIDQNIFYINKESIVNLIEKFPILEKFKINKIYPNTISITLEETKPLAKIIIKNEMFIIGLNGNLFKGKNINYDVPIIEGNLELKKINSFLEKIQSSKFDLSFIDKIIFYPSNRWDIFFKNKTIIRLPSQNINESIKHAQVLFYKEDFKNKIIDLRIKNKVIVSNE